MIQVRRLPRQIGRDAPLPGRTSRCLLDPMLQLVKKGFLDRGLGLEPPEKVKVTGKEENEESALDKIQCELKD